MKRIPFDAHVMLFLHKMLMTSILFGIGGYFMWQYVSGFDYYALFMLDENSPITEGKVVDEWIVDWDFKGNPSLHEYEYLFYSEAGEPITWVSFSKRDRYNKDDKIMIRYNAKEPRFNRAEGLGSNPYVFPFFWGLLPLVGGIVALYFGRYVQVLDILHHRRITYGQLIKKEGSMITVNDNKLYYMTFQFKTHDGKIITTSVRTTEPNELQDEPRELLAYHEKYPHRIVMADSLYGPARNFLYDEYDEQEKQMTS